MALQLASYSVSMVGWPSEKANALIEELMAFATRPRFVSAHQWRLGDVLIWANVATLHRATPFDDRLFQGDTQRTTCRARHSA